MYPPIVENQVSEQASVIKNEKKRVGYSTNNPDSSTMARPGSGKSMVTTNTFPTQNQTAISTGMSGISNIIIDKNSKLTEYIKYDSALGREQNITMGKESSLSNGQQMRIEEGVVLKQFAPFKESYMNIDDENVTSTVEDKLKERFQSEEYKNRKVTFQKEGSKFGQSGRLTRNEYFTQYGGFMRAQNLVP